MKVILDHWELVYCGLAIAGGLAWLIAAAGGLRAYLRLFGWAASVDRPGAYAKAGAASLGIVAGLAALLYLYFVALGFLALILMPM